MSIREHGFTGTIIGILDKHTGGQDKDLLRVSPLLQYLNIKTEAAERGSKAHSGFANHCTIYVLAEDYLENGFDKTTSINPMMAHNFLTF